MSRCVFLPYVCICAANAAFSTTLPVIARCSQSTHIFPWAKGNVARSNARSAVAVRANSAVAAAVGIAVKGKVAVEFVVVFVCVCLLGNHQTGGIPLGFPFKPKKKVPSIKRHTHLLLLLLQKQESTGLAAGL